MIREIQNVPLHGESIIRNNLKRPHIHHCTCASYTLTHLCPGKDYWEDFYNVLHMNPSHDQMRSLNFSPSGGTFS